MHLPSRLRIKESATFAELKAKGRSIAARSLVLSFRTLPEQEEFRFGLITSRKLGNAVTRNRVRRRLREIIRKHRAAILPQVQLVIIARWRAAELEQADLEKDLLYLAKKANILLPHPTASEPGPPSKNS
jgi:ribonuclease P protein component